MRRQHLRAAVAGLLVALVVVAAGSCAASRGGSGAAGRQVVDVTMTDNSFVPARLVLRAGPTTFRFHNDGTVDHEAVLGDQDAQDQHGSAMDHGGHHMGGAAMTGRVAPGRSATVAVDLQPGTLLLECHQPGHLESGMRSVVQVRASSQR